MKLDINDLPENVIIQATKADLLAMAEKLLQANQKVFIPEEPDTILDFRGMCDFLKIAAPTGYAKTSKGEIPHFKRGRKLFFRRSELIKWLEEGRRKNKKDLDELANTYLHKSKKY